MSDDTPTQRLDTPAPEGHVEPEEKKSRGLMIALIAIGALLLIALIILLIVLLGGNGKPVAAGTKSPTASASDTPTPTPTATVTPTPTPAPTPTTAPPPCGAGASNRCVGVSSLMRDSSASCRGMPRVAHSIGAE